MTDSDVEFDPDIDESPILTFVRHYWQRQRGDSAMPRRQDISPSDMRAHLPHILLADVVGNGEDFRYRLIGSELQRYFRGNPTGKLMSEALAPFGAETVTRTIQTYAAVLARGAPLRIRGTGELYSQSTKYFDALLAPLSNDGRTPNMVLGTFVFAWDFGATRKMPAIVEPDEMAMARALCAGK